MLLRVHPSNFRMVGFTEMVSRNALAGLGRELGLVTMEDLGSGALHNLRELGQPAEDLVQDVVSAGIDVVAFSGDKLLGGPQAGLLIGREPVITPMRRHPLMRALRLDKLSLAALEATLRLHRREDWAQIPALRMMAQNGVLLQRRAEKLAAQLGNLALIEASEGEAGGGTLPAQPIPSVAVTLKAEVSAECLSKRLRTGRPPVIGRIVRDRVWLDMLTVADADVDALSAAVLQACA
jgi:L-seryl-tRNA(Ser) seleniumtransferase